MTATLIKQGFNVKCESGAGAEAKFRDDDYAAAGAKMVDRKSAFDSGKISLQFLLYIYSSIYKFLLQIVT